MGVKKKITDLDRRLEILLMKGKEDVMERLAEVEVYNEFKPWTPLKLVGLSYLPKQYLNIVQRQLKDKYRNLKVFYIDLFAGSGLNKIGNFPPLLGSPLLVIDCATQANGRFDYMYFVDSSPEYTDALKKRLEILSEFEEYSWIENRYKVITKDANKAADEISEELDKIKYKNCLVFIDPYKWEFKMENLRKMLNLYGDALITLQATLIAKEIGKYIRQGLREKTVNEITEFFGYRENIWRNFNTESKVKNAYIDIIKNYKGYVEDIVVRSGNNFNFKYFMIFTSKRKDPPWKNWIESLKVYVESFSGDLVEHCFNRMLGKEKRLTDIPHEKKTKGNTQKSLEDFNNQ